MPKAASQVAAIAEASLRTDSGGAGVLLMEAIQIRICLQMGLVGTLRRTAALLGAAAAMRCVRARAPGVAERPAIVEVAVLTWHVAAVPVSSVWSWPQAVLGFSHALYLHPCNNIRQCFGQKLQVTQHQISEYRCFHQKAAAQVFKGSQL